MCKNYLSAGGVGHWTKMPHWTRQVPYAVMVAFRFRRVWTADFASWLHLRCHLAVNFGHRTWIQCNTSQAWQPWQPWQLEKKLRHNLERMMIPWSPHGKVWPWKLITDPHSTGIHIRHDHSSQHHKNTFRSTSWVLGPQMVNLCWLTRIIG